MSVDASNASDSCRAHLCLVLHNHQPIGNFDGVFEQAYQDSYLPFLEVYEPYEAIRISLHTSGPLMMWLATHHPEYLDRLRLLVEAGRVEIVGGPQYEPILAMLPSRDRQGQIEAYSNWLERTLGARPTTMWTPERVWESSLAADVVDAGIRATVLDDYHFKAAGLDEDQLTGYFVTEDQGRVLRIFPGSEKLRYTIPFQEPDATIDYCREMAQRHPGIVLTFGDDGEKFGTWPDTKRHVYEDGWLRRFFDALVQNSDWLHTTTLSDAVASTAPAGKVYLPDCSYREMTLWALPNEAQATLDAITHDSAIEETVGRLMPFVRGGFWRNFKVKYEETAEMYSRMMDVSSRLADAERRGIDAGELATIRDHLYRGQCNCPYWHGAFGGVYLPHLRNAIYNHLITADTLLARATGETGLLATADDYNFDGVQEIRVSSPQHCLFLEPARGGHLTEWDVRSIAHNLLATLQRRPEDYHRKVLGGPSESGDDVASIHDRVVFKQADLDQRLHYDRDRRKSLMDRFFADGVGPEQLLRGEAEERGDFVGGVYEAKIRRGDGRLQVQMSRDGNAAGHPVRITKAVTVEDSSDEIVVQYLLEGLPADTPLHFGIELNYAGLPSHADDRYFSDEHGNGLGQLQTQLDLTSVRGLMLSDRWLDIDAGLNFDRETDVWTYPVETVSQSEAGFELVHQCVCVVPHWKVVGDASGRWAVTMRLTSRTSAEAEASSETAVHQGSV